ncbi:putative GPI-anchored protein LORELEI [Helianthus annuus]|uniref:GPI-anchored protein LORELEI n=1 Tax=Helianthus annuus TaxID=4232 RepID=A0A251TAF1_HELAN|nr:GPI-anchored protein LLG1 [Helianthus annuus]KAF5781341.1 putative GPI-anchored protein LORELEI [Helianthus annuus]KAJ0508629.1 putative GPI-anchored protein LORELEI [Helianthus annuus]KAJ0516860.1 putative GPI-anchored protein LORELEI [Helianthus annuus]KAJ0684865.1 putative GPI-anchored protein LORELEI [Helianthus annuus]
MKILISFLLLLCCISTCFSSPPVSINSEPSFGRNLLQAKKACPISFEIMNYTIITSRCKAPQYPPTPCCDAFKEFACPYAADLNDLSNDCSSKMFGYINTYGNYSEGLFANLCRDDKIGLICPASPPTNVIGADSNNSPNIHGSSLLMLTVGFLILFMLI